MEDNLKYYKSKQCAHCQTVNTNSSYSGESKSHQGLAWPGKDSERLWDLEGSLKIL